MTCVRPWCTRPRDRGVHCRKCHRGFVRSQHNNRYVHGNDNWSWPCYDGSPKEWVPFVDAVLAHLPEDET